MITGFEIENFKGIRDRVKLDFRPITLLFGANSAGKSTVLHALHYLHEIFLRQNLNPDTTLDGGEHIDLGGFQGFIHAGDTDRAVSLCIHVDTSSILWPTLDAPLMPEDERTVHEDIFTSPDSICVEVRVAWSHLDAATYIQSMVFTFDHVAIAKTAYQPGRTTFDWMLNVRHPLFALLGDSDLLSNHFGHAFDGVSDTSLTSIEAILEGNANAITNQVADHVWYETQLDGTTAWPNAIFATPSIFMDNEVADEYLSKLVDDTLFQVFKAPLEIVCKELSKFLYIGPLRKLPARVHQPPRFKRRSRWATGLGGWDDLFTCSDSVAGAVSRWLEDEDCLNTGYGVEVKQTIELDLSDPFVRRLYDGRAFDDIDGDERQSLSRLPIKRQLVILNAEGYELSPHDVGIGISQVLPVIVAAVGRKEHLISVEQPELHLHPRVQAALGDLFVEAINKFQNCFIIETHSEHLILRLLRRIRETEVNKAPAGRTLRTDDLAIYYMKHEDGSSRALQIDVDVKGEFIQPWPDDFFEIDFYERFKTGDEG